MSADGFRTLADYGFLNLPVRTDYAVLPIIYTVLFPVAVFEFVIDSGGGFAIGIAKSKDEFGRIGVMKTFVLERPKLIGLIYTIMFCLINYFSSLYFFV